MNCESAAERMEWKENSKGRGIHTGYRHWVKMVHVQGHFYSCLEKSRETNRCCMDLGFTCQG